VLSEHILTVSPRIANLVIQPVKHAPDLLRVNAVPVEPITTISQIIVNVPHQAAPALMELTLTPQALHV